MQLRRSDAALPGPRAILAGSLFAAFNAMFTAAIASSGRPCSPDPSGRSKSTTGSGLGTWINVSKFIARAPRRSSSSWDLVTG